VADYLRIGRTKVYELMATGDLRSVKIGRARRVTQAAVDQFVEKSEHATMETIR